MLIPRPHHSISLSKMASNRKFIASEANCLEVVHNPNGEVYLTYHPETTIACVLPNGDHEHRWRCCERRSDESGCTTHVVVPQTPQTPPDSPICGPGQLQRQFGVREPVYSPSPTSPPPSTSSQEASHNRSYPRDSGQERWQGRKRAVDTDECSAS